MRPVIQPGALELFVGDLKTQRFDQVKAATGGHTQSPDVSGIVGNLRVEQNDVEGHDETIDFRQKSVDGFLNL